MRHAFAAAFLVAVFAVSQPVSAAVVPVSKSIAPGTSRSASTTLEPGDTGQFTFTALADLLFNVIATSGTGSNFGLDLAAVRFGFTNTPSTAFSSITTLPGGTSSGQGSLPGGKLLQGESFTIFWGGDFKNEVALTATVVATEIPPVPLPAALPLLLVGLGTLFGLRRKASVALPA